MPDREAQRAWDRIVSGIVYPEGGAPTKLHPADLEGACRGHAGRPAFLARDKAFKRMLAEGYGPEVIGRVSKAGAKAVRGRLSKLKLWPPKVEAEAEREAG